MSLAAFIASQRTDHRVPHAVACRALDVSESWFYKWRDREPTPAQRRRAELDAKVAEIFEDSGGEPRTHGSPRVHAELRDQGCA
jgi:putative transposase